MAKEVKNIFVILIGTIAGLVFISLFTEVINVNMNAIRLQSQTKMACEKALVLFSQETYKTRDAEGRVSGGAKLGGTVNMDSVKTADGSEYVSGKFYKYDTVAETYNSLYKSSAFTEWVKRPDIKGKWKPVDLINRIVNNPSSFSQKEMPEYTYFFNEYAPESVDYNFDNAVNSYTEYLMAKSYGDNFITPLNFGVPYIDKDVAERIFKWNLARIMSDYNDQSIVLDDFGEYCIQKDGFCIYADQAKITNITYTVYNLNKSNEAKAFKELTLIEPDKLGFADEIEYLGDSTSTESDERRNICVIGVEYSVPIAYIGITPIKSIFRFVWDRQVQGLEEEAPDYGVHEFNTAKADMTGGGAISGTGDGVLPVPGKLIFYLVR